MNNKGLTRTIFAVGLIVAIVLSTLLSYGITTTQLAVGTQVHKGDTGAQGPKGDAGEPGAKGLQGQMDTMELLELPDLKVLKDPKGYLTQIMIADG